MITDLRGNEPRLAVRRCQPRLESRGRTVAQKTGLAYERKVVKELQRLAATLGGSCEHNPWFEYREPHDSMWQCAVPDAIMRLGGAIYVVEVKLTFVLDAVEKLHKTYLPIVRAGLCATPDVKVFSLVIAKNLTPEANPHISRLAQVTDKSRTPVLQWLGHGQIMW